jgi:hypothetical protein
VPKRSRTTDAERARAVAEKLKAEAARRPEDLPAMVEALRAEFSDLFGALPPIPVGWAPYLVVRRLGARWDDWLRRIEVNPLISAALLRGVLLHELCHAAAGEMGHGAAFQRWLGELATRGEQWAAEELREYATKGTPEEQAEVEVLRERARKGTPEQRADARARLAALGVPGTARRE